MSAVVFFMLMMALNIWLRRRYPRTSERRERPSLRALRKLVTLDPPAESLGGVETSLYRRIEEQAANDPSAPIEYTPFPPMPAEEPGTYYFPGARDIFAPRDQPVDDVTWQRVVALVELARRDKIRDWRVLERNVAPIDAARAIDTVLRRLTFQDITTGVRRLFRSMARGSSDYNAVKWGIIIGAIDMDPAQIKDLNLLARHSEFTVYVTTALAREKKRKPALADALSDLLATTEGWGLCQVIRSLRSDASAPVEHDVRRAALVTGMRNGAAARGQIVSEILAFMDLDPFIDEACEADDVAEALMDLAIEVFGEGRTFVIDPARERHMVHRFLRLAEVRPTSIELLRMIRAIGIALSADGDETGNAVGLATWSEREAQLERAREIFMVKLTREAIADAISSDRHKIVALEIAAESGMQDLAPLVLDDFRVAPNPANATALGTLGDERHLAIMLAALKPLAAQRVDAGDSADFSLATITYGIIVRHIGRLGRRSAFRAIAAAARDANPFVRSCAMNALERAQRWTLDRATKECVRACLADPAEMVRNAAERAAQHHTLQASINRIIVAPAMEELGLSRN